MKSRQACQGGGRSRSLPGRRVALLHIRRCNTNACRDCTSTSAGQVRHVAAEPAVQFRLLRHLSTRQAGISACCSLPQLLRALPLRVQQAGRQQRLLLQLKRAVMFPAGRLAATQVVTFQAVPPCAPPTGWRQCLLFKGAGTSARFYSLPGVALEFERHLVNTFAV